MKGYDWQILDIKKRNLIRRLLSGPFIGEHKALVQYKGRLFWVNINLADAKKDINFHINYTIWRKFYRKAEMLAMGRALIKGDC